MIARGRAQDILQAFAGKRVLVVGDVMLDRYVSGRVTRISPEAPVPVIEVAEERTMPGGASNVALNIQSLGGQAVVAGFVGDDSSGQELERELRAHGISTDALVSVANGRTTVKTRVIAERQQVVRIDWENRQTPAEACLDQLCDRVVEQARLADGVIIEDYGKGVVSQRVVDTLLAVCAERDIVVGFDPNYNHCLSLSGITLATPNYREALDAAGLGAEVGREAFSEGPLRQAAEILAGRWDLDLLIITLGPQGMFLRSRDGRTRTIPTQAHEVFDVSGAGDTVIAAGVLALVGGASHDEAAGLANCAGGIVVGKLGAAACKKEEILESLL